MSRKAAKAYPTWLKAYRKSGSPTFPQAATLVFIHWTDAAYSEEHPGTVEAWVVGFLRSADDKSVALAMEAFDDGDTRTYITVPAGMVNSITTLGTADLKKPDA